MTIANRIAKAEDDYRKGDFENALLQVLVATAATSRKRYPTRPDWDAFETFVRDEFGRGLGDNITLRGVLKVFIGGKMETIEHILYKFLRCELIHTGSVPAVFTFVPGDGIHLAPQTDTLVLSYGIVQALIRMVRNAPENSDLVFPVP